MYGSRGGSIALIYLLSDWEPQGACANGTRNPLGQAIMTMLVSRECSVCPASITSPGCNGVRLNRCAVKGTTPRCMCRARQSTSKLLILTPFHAPPPPPVCGPGQLSANSRTKFRNQHRLDAALVPTRAHEGKMARLRWSSSALDVRRSSVIPPALLFAHGGKPWDLLQQK